MFIQISHAQGQQTNEVRSAVPSLGALNFPVCRGNSGVESAEAFEGMSELTSCFSLDKEYLLIVIQNPCE